MHNKTNGEVTISSHISLTTKFTLNFVDVKFVLLPPLEEHTYHVPKGKSKVLIKLLHPAKNPESMVQMCVLIAQ